MQGRRRHGRREPPPHTTGRRLPGSGSTRRCLHRCGGRSPLPRRRRHPPRFRQVASQQELDLSVQAPLLLVSPARERRAQARVDAQQERLAFSHGFTRPSRRPRIHRSYQYDITLIPCCQAVVFGAADGHSPWTCHASSGSFLHFRGTAGSSFVRYFARTASRTSRETVMPGMRFSTAACATASPMTSWSLSDS
jgi:hypothetical protein